MNRPQQVTRSMTVAAQAPEPRDLSTPRAWSAMLMSDTTTYLSAGDWADLATNVPRHATFGDADFDISDYPVVKLIVPWDGIYAITAWVQVYLDGTPTYGIVRMTIATSAGDVDAGYDAHNYQVGNPIVLQSTRVAFPMTAGTRIWAYAGNDTDASGSFQINHLEATYLCPLGTLYPIKGGGET